MPTKKEINEFSKEIDALVVSKDLNYLEAILYYCENNGLEIEVAATLLSKNLRAKLESFALDNKLIKGKQPRLPI